MAAGVSGSVAPAPCRALQNASAWSLGSASLGYSTTLVLPEQEASWSPAGQGWCSGVNYWFMGTHSAPVSTQPRCRQPARGLLCT